MKPLTIKPLTGGDRESHRAPAAEDDAKIDPKDGGDETGSKNGADSDEADTDADAESHVSIEMDERSAKMSRGPQRGPAADDDARMFSKDGTGDDGRDNDDDPRGDERDKTDIDADSASVNSDDHG